MDAAFFIRGLVIGISIAAAVGPMSVLCIQRTLYKGQLYGLVSGLGIATADGVYGCIAGFGLTVVATFLVNQEGWIRLVGGLFLVYLGVKTVLTKPAERVAPARANKHNFLGAYASTFLLTLTNPITILSFVAIFAGIGVGGGKNSALSATLVGSIFRLGNVVVLADGRGQPAASEVYTALAAVDQQGLRLHRRALRGASATQPEIVADKSVNVSLFVTVARDV